MKLIIFCVSLIFLSCQSHRTEIMEKKQNEEKIDSMEIIKQTLEKESNIVRQDPFVIREFDPYLNGKWIGSAISYGCYRKGQAPGVKGPSESEILQDLKLYRITGT